MDIRHLQYFIQVARCSSFTKAAAALYITQPTISKMIKNLEDEMGVILFERVGRRVELTDTGKVLFAEAQMMVQAFENMRSQLNDLMGLKKGEIRIGLPPMVGASIFPRIIGEFSKRYPGIQIAITEDGAKKVEEDVAGGRLDIGVAVWPTDEDMFDYVSIWYKELLLVVDRKHPLAARKEVRLEELQEESFILFREDFVLHDRIIEECVRSGFQPRIAYKSSQWDLISGMVEAGLGIALLPETICRQLGNREVRIVPLASPAIPWHLVMIWRKERYLSYAAREWIAFIRSLQQEAES